jgi:hypothetical protein
VYLTNLFYESHERSMDHTIAPPHILTTQATLPRFFPPSKRACLHFAPLLVMELRQIDPQRGKSQSLAALA